MSNAPQPSPLRDPRPGEVVWHALLGVGLILVFVAIVAVVYLRHQPPSLDQPVAEERMRRLAAVQSSGQKLLSEYAWVDQPNGVVRIPIERAMDLTVQRLAPAPAPAAP